MEKRRYLDVELKEKEITKENMKKIQKAILGKYGIHLEELLDGDKVHWDRIVIKAANKCFGYACKFIPSLAKVMEESINYGGVFVQADKNSNEGCKDDKLDNQSLKEEKYYNSEKKYWNFCNWLQEDEFHKQKKYAKKLEFNEWKEFINSMVRWGNLIDEDCYIQCLFRLKYTLSSLNEEKTTLFQGNERREVMIHGRYPKDHFFLNDTNGIPSFIKELQLLFLVEQRYIRMFDFGIFGNRDSYDKLYRYNIDITRYSYKYIEELYDKIENSGLENYYYLDDILGVSLTNTIFNYIILGSASKVKMEEAKDIEIDPDIFSEDLFSIIRLISGVQCIYGRNHLAKIIFYHIYQYEFDANTVHNIYTYLDKNIKEYNVFFNDLCDMRVWFLFHDIEEWSYEEKVEVINELEGKYCDKIKDSIIDKNIAQFPKYKEDKEEYKLKRAKAIKKADNAYAQIHMAVMEGRWIQNN